MLHVAWAYHAMNLIIIVFIVSMNPITDNHAGFKTTADYTVKNTEYWRMRMQWIPGALFFSPVSHAPRRSRHPLSAWGRG